METERQRRLRKLDEEFGAYMRDVEGQPFYIGHDAWNYVLVEKSSHDASYYVTMHPTAGHAALYHDQQEYPEDWQIDFLEDLRNAKRYRAITSTRFEEED